MRTRLNQFEIRRWGNFCRLLGFCLILVYIVFGCSGKNARASLKTPEGVVNAFIDRILKEKDFASAYELLCEADKQVIKEKPQAYNFIKGFDSSEIDRSTLLFSKLAPDVLDMVGKLLKIQTRKGEAQEGYIEVAVEISYPSNYMTLYMTGLGLANSIARRLQGVALDSISNDQMDKLIWSIKNDIQKVLSSIKTESYSSYIFPVKVVKEEGNWRLNLNLSTRRIPFDLN